jgi:ribosomal protein S18 acetylase RimI-like enzyme
MTDAFEITAARPEDAADLASIYITVRCVTMPYLPELHTPSEIGDWFVGRVKDTPDAFYVVRCADGVVGYMYLYQGRLDDLYVLPNRQGLGIGSALIEQAKLLSPQLIELSTFQQNGLARAFYERHGFREIGPANCDNYERDPAVPYEWTRP